MITLNEVWVEAKLFIKKCRKNPIIKRVYRGIYLEIGEIVISAGIVKRNLAFKLQNFLCISGGISMKNCSLQTKLYLMILIVLIPLLVLKILYIVDYNEQAIELEIQAKLEYTKAVRATFLNYLYSQWDFGLSVGLTIVSSDFSADETDIYLQELVAGMNAVEDFFWVSSNGVIQASTLANARGQSVLNLDVIQQILQGADQEVSDLIVEPVTNNIMIHVARAIRRDGQLVGIFVIALKPEEVEKVFPTERNPTSKSVGFVDPQGMMVFQTRDETRSRWEYTLLLEDAPSRLALKGQTVLNKKYVSPIDGNSNMEVILPIPKIGWGVFVSSSRDVILAKVGSQTYWDLVALLLVTAISLIAAMALGIHFLRPVKRLQQTALEISKGHFSARTEMEGSDELATTGQIFDKMAGRIQELEESRLQFLQTAAHELRNPMAGIKGILSLIKRKVDQGKGIEGSQQMLEVMEKEIDRLSKLLDQILEAFRTQREPQYLSLQCAKINLSEVITTAMEPFFINEKSVQISFESPTRLEAWVFGDFVRLEEVVRNLLSNAIKYSSPQSNIRVRLKEHGKDWIIAIQDQGIGIPQGQLKSVFDCFQRASNVQEGADPGGLGLGLYICKMIIEGHHGSIWVTSEEGYGSTFYIRIPKYQNKR